MVGQNSRMKAGLFGSIIRTPGVRKEEKRVEEKAREELAYVGVAKRHHDNLAINLAYGDQRRVEIARALASDPKVLLLDEPTAGMNPQESDELTNFMRKLREERGITIVLIEHDMKVIMGVSEHITVLDHGEKIAEGGPAEVRKQPARDRGVPRQGGRRDRRERLAMAFLEVTDIHTYYGNIQALKGITLEVNEGECVTLIGSNGAGKSTTLRSISGLTPPRDRLDQARRRGDLAAAAAGDRAARHLPVAGGAQVLPAHDGAREPRARRVPAPRQRGDPQGPRPRLRAVPAAEGARGAEGGHDVRRRAADARDRPRDDGAAEAAAARRAVDGHRADPRRAHLRDDRGDQPAGHDDPAGRAERQLRARGLQARLRAGDRKGRDDRRLGRRCGPTPKCRRPTSEHDPHSLSWALRRCG